MHENLTIKKNEAIARIVLGDSLSYFNISNIKELSSISPFVKSDIDLGLIKDSHSFEELFPSHEEHFFYSAQFFDIKTHELLISEFGIGYHKDGIVFRDTPLGIISDNKTSPAPSGGFNFLGLLSENYGIIKTYTPLTLGELLLKPHSVIVSDDDPGPNIVSLPENSLLGRLGGNICSISLDSLLSLLPMAQRLLSVILSCRILNLMPAMRKNVAGNMIFNLKNRKLEFFDGSDWFEIQMTKADKT